MPKPSRTVCGSISVGKKVQVQVTPWALAFGCFKFLPLQRAVEASMHTDDATSPWEMCAVQALVEIWTKSQALKAAWQNRVVQAVVELLAE